VESEHFTSAELACRHCKVNACAQDLVDALEAIGPAALAVMVEEGKATDEQKAAGRLPVHLDCAYRCPAHNLAVGGVPDSEHTRGLAADIKMSGMTTRQMYQAAVKVPAFRDGGIGVAAHQGYIHVDVRGTHARWLYDIAGRATSMWDASLDSA
jgi:hypothetical protein